MPSPQLQTVRDMLRSFADASGTPQGLFEIDRLRAALGPTPFDWPPDVSIVEADATAGRWLVPANGSVDHRILYIHGGGLIRGGFRSHGAIAAWIARHSRCVVFFADYRLAPEHVFPAALEDVRAALIHIVKSGPGGSGAACSIALAGDSAGAGLASALLMDGASPAQQARAALLLCPMLDWDETHSPALRTSSFRRAMALCYAAGHDRRDPALSPLFGDWSRLPPLMIDGAGADEFLPDAREAARRAAAAGVDVEFCLVPEMPHVWHRFAPFLPEGEDALRRGAVFLQRRLHHG
jgi:acetyl esterase/lipase